MFTGIVEAKGKVKSASTKGALKEVAVSVPSSWKLSPGQSVAVDGVCLTVVKRAAGSMTAELMGETLKKTTGPEWKKGRVVNLERALRFGDRLDGHLVLGHVEGVASVARIEKDGASRRLTLRVPRALFARVREKGSVAVNGVSLTVAKKAGMGVELALVPYTLAHTNLGALRTGDAVNLETDALTSGRVNRNAARRTRKGA